MKKLVLLIMMVLTNVLMVQAQTDTVMYAPDLNNSWHYICFNLHEKAIVYAPDGCDDINWLINGQSSTDNPITLDGNVAEFFQCNFNGWNCGQYAFAIVFRHPNVPNETTEDITIHSGELAELQALGIDSVEMYSLRWNTGETENIIFKPRGTYVVGISDECATSYRTKHVEENVEIGSAGVDLATGDNDITWTVIPELIGVYDQVKVIRDSYMTVGYTAYADGHLLDVGVGSDDYGHQYQIVGILHDGTECPIPSYIRGTPHVDYSESASGDRINMSWTAPYIQPGAPISIAYYRIDKYNPVTHQTTNVSNYIPASNTIASFPKDDFDGCFAVLGVVFNYGRNRDDENISYSNLSNGVITATTEITETTTFEIYPNPSRNGTITVRAKEWNGEESNEHNLTICNMMGQVVFSGTVNGVFTTPHLAPGIYVVRLNGISKKVEVLP